jgi:hypothetical protein
LEYGHWLSNGLARRDFSCILDFTNAFLVPERGFMPRQISEDTTRKEMIDPSMNSGRRPQLERAGRTLRDRSKVFDHAA